MGDTGLVLIAAGVILVLVLFAAWRIDRHDARSGHKVKDAKLLGEHIRVARRERRAELLGRGPLARLRRDDERPTNGYRAPDGSRRPVKRGQ